jgi:hypothetical protein
MEPLLMKFRGHCLVSNILTAGGKRFDSLRQLDAYPNGVCWLHTIDYQLFVPLRGVGHASAAPAPVTRELRAAPGVAPLPPPPPQRARPDPSAPLVPFPSTCT